MPDSTASRTVATHSSRVVAPQIRPRPPPPSVNALAIPNLPNGLCCMPSSVVEFVVNENAPQALRTLKHSPAAYPTRRGAVKVAGVPCHAANAV